MTLRTQLVLSTCLSFLFLGGLLFFLFSKLSDIYRDKTEKYIQSVFDQYADGAKSRLESLGAQFLLTVNDPSLQAFVDAGSPLSQYETYRVFTNNLYNYMGMMAGFEDYVVLASEGNSYNLPSDPTYLGMVQSLADQPEVAGPGKKLRFSPVRRLSFGGGPDTRFFLLGVDGSRSTSISDRIFIAIRINVSNFFPDTQKLPYIDQWLYGINDLTGQVVSSSEAENLFRPEEPVPFHYTRYHRELPSFGEVWLEVPDDFLTRDIAKAQVGTLVILVVLFLPILMLNLLIIERINRTNQSLIASIRGISHRGEGDPELRLPQASYRESQELLREFQAMNQSLLDMGRELVEKRTKLYVLELKAQAAEHEYLLTQINPHFLYNSFETIKGMAAMAGLSEIVTMTTSLSRIFRYSLKAEAEVPLREEIATARAYTSIQELRFANRFKVEYAIPDELLECQVPKMILQPLIENAIVHGLEGSSKDGFLRIAARDIDGSRFELIVRDNGGGMSAEQLAQVRAHYLRDDPNQPPDRRAHIGLKNVHERIRLAYGAAYGLSLESSDQAPQGTSVRIELPLTRRL